MAGLRMTFRTNHLTIFLLTTCVKQVVSCKSSFIHDKYTLLMESCGFLSADGFLNVVPKFQGENFYKNKAIVEEIKKLAVRKGCTLAQIALAWVAAQGMIALPGTTKAHRLEENWASRDVDLTEEEKQELREVVNKAKPVGNRYNERLQAMVGH